MSTERKMSVFLAAPFLSDIDPATGSLRSGAQELIKTLVDHFEGRGFEVQNAHRREAWGAAFLAPSDYTRLDFDEIEAADVLVAIPGSPPSPGTHIEIGWATALRKPVVLLFEPGKTYAGLLRGLGEQGRVRIIELDGTAVPDGLDSTIDSLLSF